MSRKPPHAPQRSRANLSTRSQLPQAIKQREQEKKFIDLETEGEEKQKRLTKRQAKVDRTNTIQHQQRDTTTRSSQRLRPKHGDNKWKRNLALARYNTPPEIRSFNYCCHQEARRASCDFQLSGSSDSSQEEEGTTTTIAASSTTLEPLTSRSSSPHPLFASSSTNCSPIYRRRTIPTILVTDMDRRRLSPLMLRDHDYMERVQVLSHSMPMLFRNDENKRKLQDEVGHDINGQQQQHTLPPLVSRSRPSSGRSSVVKLPPISPQPHPLMASAKEKNLADLRTTYLM